MKTVTIHLEIPHGTALIDVYAALRSIGCEVRMRDDGTIYASPARGERFGNGNVVRFLRSGRQGKTARIEDPTEAA